jgi:hypothetical protein
MASQRFCLRWNNHQSNLLSVFDQLLHAETFTDVTLAIDGQYLKAHKVRQSRLHLILRLSLDEASGSLVIARACQANQVELFFLSLPLLSSFFFGKKSRSLDLCASYRLYVSRMEETKILSDTFDVSLSSIPTVFSVAATECYRLM